VLAATTAGVYRVPGQGATAPLVRDHDGAAGAVALLTEGDGALLANASGLFRVRPGSKPVPVEPRTLTACTGLARDGRGDVWVATPQEVYRLRDSRLEGPFAPAAGAPVGRVCGLAAGKETVWVWAASGLACIADGRWRPVPWPRGGKGEPLPQAVRAVACGGDDDFLWVGTDRRLALVWLEGRDAFWDADLLPAHPEDGLNNLGRCAAGPGADGTVWVGTAGGLVAFRPDGTWQLDAAAGDVRALCPGPGALHLLTWPRGSGQLTAAGAVQFDARPPAGVPLALAPGRDGVPHLLTTRALWRLGPGEPAAVADGGDPGAGPLAQGADGTWWLGTPRGVQRRTPAGRWEAAGEQPGPAQAEATGFAVVGDTLWAATTAGLWAHDGGGWRRHLPGEEVVRAVAPAGGAGALWVAGEARLVRYAPATGQVTASYTPADTGLGSARVVALCEAAGALWVVTQCGVGRLKLE
jgi:ligand-binding sensor domain-containing protein